MPFFNSFIKKLFFNTDVVKTFFILRLSKNQVKEKAFIKSAAGDIDISSRHSMICLDPFCVAIWLSAEELSKIDPANVNMQIRDGAALRASLVLSLTEKTEEKNCHLLLLKVEKAKCHQYNPVSHFVLFYYLLRNKTSKYKERETISALYSYPRNVIVVSYKDDTYFNIFPMDIQGYIPGSDLYLLGLRTTNITLEKILNTKKLVVCDTDTIDVKTIYSLGKHLSAAPPKVEELPFKTINSELFGFPVPDLIGSYHEIEIIRHQKMGYHMLLVGRIVNTTKLKTDTASLYHIGYLEYKKSSYREAFQDVY